MVTITIEDEISGKPVTIPNPLRAEHIEVGRLLWYHGYTSISGWNCPAMIIKVDELKRRFRIRSLDDMKEQDEWYYFDLGPNSSSSRKSMRLVDEMVIKTYLESQRNELATNIKGKQTALTAAEQKLKHFDLIRSQLLI